MTVHLQAKGGAYDDSGNRGHYTACGVWSPEVRHESPFHGRAMVVYPLRMTTDAGRVTCKRCLKSPNLTETIALSAAGQREGGA